jgi:hypothetical protein
MKIAIFGDYNIAGNLTLLSELINKHTVHEARCIIVVGDYLDYNSDIILTKDPEGKKIDRDAANEAEVIVSEADFYHIGNSPINFGAIKFEKLLNDHNCIIQYFGSYLRNNKKEILEFHNRSRIKGITWVDATMMEGAGPMYYHLPDIFDVSKVKPWWEYQSANDLDINQPIKIVHSPTNREFKKTDFFIPIIERLKTEYPIELILLENLSNKDCIEQKQQAHILFDQISVGRFALSAIESMAMGQAVLCSVSNLVMSSFPDNPVIPVTEETLELEIIKLLKNRDSIKKIGEAGIKWVTQNCDPIRAVKQYIHLYDYIMNGNRLIKASENQFLEA